MHGLADAAEALMRECGVPERETKDVPEQKRQSQKFYPVSTAAAGGATRSSRQRLGGRQHGERRAIVLAVAGFGALTLIAVLSGLSLSG